MVSAVQAVVGRVELVSQRASSGGRYVSVTVGPVLVTSPDDVAEIYSRMRGDGRLRYFL
jgi:putative lipoic acid-binding regulatory protein